jgi:Flp pilus assembly protein TadB
MQQSRAEAIAQALMAPDLQVQQEVRRKRAAQSAQLARRRRIAWFFLAGAGLGAAVVWYAGVRFSVGVLFGGLAGAVTGWLATWRTAA